MSALTFCCNASGTRLADEANEVYNVLASAAWYGVADSEVNVACTYGKRISHPYPVGEIWMCSPSGPRLHAKDGVQKGQGVARQPGRRSLMTVEEIRQHANHLLGRAATGL